LSKKKLAIYTATGCRGCEHAILDLHYQVNPLTRGADLCFWPYLLGSKWEEMQEADVAIFAGALRTEADVEAARRLREKSGLLVALGACAAFGGLPGLINLAAPEEPGENRAGDTGASALPEAMENVAALPEVAPVDYIVPGCPPPQNFLWALMQCLLGQPGLLSRISFAARRLPEAVAQAVTAGVLPPKGSTFAGEKAVCASCSRVKEEKRFKAYHRPHLLELDEGLCLLEQGLLCQGLATREGCGGLCTGVGLPCRGCFGKAEAIYDPGAKLVSAISSTFDSADPEELANIVKDMVDLKGTFYRYTAPSQCVLLAKPARAAEAEPERETEAAAKAEPAA
jgi:F420-non-reducing hydrogenase small subunit